ncbi:MAG: efflux RND transporter permease subunit, partial [Bacteroidetes bacterium]|nr:efflux RND transporter permease subunit [Bacteroidota bacterium]
MKLPRLAIDNYQFTLVIFILLTIAGISSFLRMPRSENPVVYIPGGGVVVIYPGAGPPDMEQLIAAPIEEAINELEDIKKINTTVTDGIASINVEFEYSTDADRKYDEVVRQVNSVRGKLPRDIFDLFIWKFSSSDVAIMQLALVGENAEYNDLEMYADRLKRLLEKVKGVRKVEIHACPKQELRISVDMEKMAGMNISLDHVINAVNSNNANIPGGNLDISGKSFSIKTSGSYSGPEQIRNTVVNSFQGRLVYIRDIADVGFEYEDNIYFGRFNGKKAVYITVQQKDGLNIFEITKNIMPELGKFRKELDRDVTLETIFDQSVIVDDRISNFLKNLAQGILLVGLVVLFALGFRSSVIVIIAIPLSIVIGLWFVDLYGLGIQQITIAGLVVALGLLVDNSIVIIENINRFRQMGHSPRDAAIMGTAQIGWPVVSSTVTTLLAFIPIIMMPDKAGDFIRGLPVTIMATLTVSLLIALTLSPMIARLLFRKKIQAASGITGISQKKGFQRSLQKFIEGPYGRLLAYSLRHRFPVVAFSLVALAGAGVLFCYGVKISFFPTS